MKSTEYVLGFVVGALIGLIIVAIALKFVGCGKKGNLDERMIAARGVAYKWGFLCFLIWNITGYALSEFQILEKLNPGFYLMLGVVVSASVYAIICIVKDAYVGLKEHAGRLVLVFFLIGALNVGIGIFNRIQPQMHEQTTIPLNFVCGIMLWALAIAMGTKKLYDRREVEE